ncbi:MAG TPA: acyloxyacyl hydrolase [Pyrinomonadaceae bacterium]|nr:acyloxyacyl hydrolase [Pyrinomonadaceae bacterium]
MRTSPQDVQRSLWSSLFLLRVIHRVTASSLLLLALPVLVLAQAPNNSSSSTSAAGAQPTTEGIQKRWNEFGLWGGISFSAPTLIGKTPDARFGNIGLRYGRVLAASKTVAFEWTIDAIPVSILSNPRYAIVPSGTGFIFTQTRKSVYAWGLAPIGLKFNFRRNRRVQPFGHATGGFLYFNEQVPIAGAARFNFTFDFSGGVQIVNSNRRAFTIGYKYQHISNGYRANFNPGVDVQMIFAGFSVFK